MPNDLIERLCCCLAFHAVETENTMAFMRPVAADIPRRIAEARALIAEAGFDFDAIYPAADRPVVSSSASAASH